jgi:hypothetical protein
MLAMAHVWKIQKREIRASGPLALQRRCHIMIFRADTKGTKVILFKEGKH